MLEYRVAGIASGPGCLHCVAIAVLMPDQPVVGAWELLRVVVQPGFPDLAIGEVDHPPIEGGGAFIGPVEIRREHPWMPHHIGDDRVAVVVSVESVKDVTRLYVEPPDVLSA